MDRFSFPITLTPDKDDGGFVVTFRDLPEAITQAETLEECITEATDCLEEAIAARIDENLDIPRPSKPKRGEKKVHLPLQMTLKAALYLAMYEAHITKVELARLMEIDEKEVRRMIDPHHGTKLPTIERALKVLGKHAEVRVS